MIYTKRIKLPLSQKDITFKRLNFKDFKAFLYIPDTNNTFNDFQVVANNFCDVDLLNNAINDIDKLYYMYSLIFYAMENYIEFNLECHNQRCKTINNFDLDVDVTEINTDIGFDDYKIKNINGDIQGLVLSNMRLGDAKKIQNKIDNKINEIKNHVFVKFDKKINCNYCKKEIKLDLELMTFKDLYLLINHYFSLKWYYQNIQILKKFNYSMLEINDMYLFEVDIIKTSEILNMERQAK